MSSDPRALIQQLASPVTEARERARAGLVAAGKAAVPALVEALGSGERDVRAGAALCLGAIGFAGAAKVLDAMAEADPDPSVRPMAARALVDLAGPGAPDAVKRSLIRHLGSADMFIRALACQGLGRIADAESRKALNRALSDAEEWVREAARKAIEASATPAEQPTADEPPCTEMIKRPAVPEARLAALLAQLASPNQAQQDEAKRALLEAGPEAETTTGVARLMRNELAPGRHAAAEVLGGLGNAASMEQLAGYLGDPAAAPIRPTMLHAMARVLTGPHRAAAVSVFPGDLVQRFLEDRDPLVRAAAVKALVSAGGAHRRAACERAATDTESWVRLSALSVLAQVAEPEDRALLPALAAQLSDGPEDPEAQLSLLLAVGRIVDPRRSAAAELGEQRHAVVFAASYFLHSDLAEIRRAAGELVARVAAPEDVDGSALTALLDLVDPEVEPDPDPGMIAAVARLAPPDHKETTEVLGRILKSCSDPQQPQAAARAAAQALAAMGSRPAVGLLVEVANSRTGAAVAIAAQTLAAMDPKAEVVGKRRPDGTWEVVVQRWCQCGGAVAWVHRQREELRCNLCLKEYVLAAGGKLFEADRTPFGTCLCPTCRRKQPLVRRPGGDALFCPLSGQVHIRPFDHPRQIRLLADLPLGACTCCAEPQPLIRVNEEVACYRTRERYRATPTGFVLSSAAGRGSAGDDVAAINQALLAGSIGIGESGLATASTLEGDDDEEC